MVVVVVVVVVGILDLNIGLALPKACQPMDILLISFSFLCWNSLVLFGQEMCIF